jgi:hypothetical protein
MKQIKMTALVVIILIVFSALQYGPAVKGQGSSNSLALRVTELEALVESLGTRLAMLEDGQVPPGTSFDILHLNPLPKFPDDPIEGDLCVVLTEWAPDIYAHNLYCYLGETWYLVAGFGPGGDTGGAAPPGI